jgi:hypothetical protein
MLLSTIPRISEGTYHCGSSSASLSNERTEACHALLLFSA